MRKNIAWLLAMMTLGLTLTGCSAVAEELTGTAQGYGGTLRVGVTVENGSILQVRILEHHETDGVGTRAIEALPDQIVTANSADVDIVSGATITSRAISEAVRDALRGTAQSPAVSDAPEQLTLPAGARAGIGVCATGRIGPGTDAAGNPVKSVNMVAASGVFDPAGRVVSLRIDQLEAAAPDVTAADDTFLSAIAAWNTKGERGGDYMLTSGSWRDEMDAFERLFTGKTVDEIDAWFAAYCSAETGKPLQADNGTDADLAKYNALSQEERDMLADVTSSATMSLRDSHGDIVTAIQRAWENAQQR